MKTQHIHSAEVFVLPSDPLFELSDIRRVRAAFDIGVHGKWLDAYVTDEHREAEANTGTGLYKVIYDPAAMQTLLLIFNKSVAAMFKLAFVGT